MYFVTLLTLSFLLGSRYFALDTFDIPGPKFRKVIVFRARYSATFNPILNFSRAKASTPMQERDDKQSLEDKQGNEIRLFI